MRRFLPPLFRLDNHSPTALILCAALCFGTITGGHAAQATDDVAARQVVQEALAAFAKRDLNAFAALYSPKSPFLAARKRDAGAAFAGLSEIRISDVVFKEVAVTGDRARVRIRANVHGILAATGKPFAGSGPANLFYELVKEDGRWKIWRERAPEMDLVDRMADAKSDEERRKLAYADPEFHTPLFLREVNARGYTLSTQGQYDAARGLLEIGSDVAEKLGDMAALANSFSSRGYIAATLGRFEEAAAFHQRALPAAEKSGNHVTIALCWNNLGEFRRMRGEFRNAPEAYLKAMEEARLGNSPAVLGLARNNLGTVYQSAGDYARAYSAFEESRREAEQRGDKAGLARTLNNIGITHLLQGNNPLALEHFRQSLGLFTELGYKLDMANLFNNLGLAHSNSGDKAKAVEYYRQAVEIRRALGLNTEVASTLNNIALELADLGRYDEAVADYRKGLEMCGPEGDPTLRARLHRNLSDAYYWQRKYVLAMEETDRAVAAARESDNPNLLAIALGMKGDVHAVLKQPAEAIRCFEEAITHVEKGRSMVAATELEAGRYFEQHVNPYIAAVRMLAAQNEPARALSYAERAKARVLLDLMDRGHVDEAALLTPAERDQELNARARLTSLSGAIRRERATGKPSGQKLADLQTALGHARLEYETLETRVRVAHPELKMRRGEIAPYKLEEAASLLPDSSTALVSYTVGRNGGCLFVVRKPAAPGKGVVIKSYALTQGRNQLAEAVRRFRDQVSDPNQPVQAGARALYDLLLKPAEAELRGVTQLIVFPDGPLWEAPFQALQSKPNRYLIEDYAVSIAPSLTVYREMVRSRQARQMAARGKSALLALGNPALGDRAKQHAKFAIRDADLAPLPDAEAEVSGLGRLYGAGARVYTGPAAREVVFKQLSKDYRIVHLATHGVLNNSNPMYSYVVLSQTDSDTTEDGLLEAWEMMNLKLSADLVVLSACETGRGRVGMGEGLVGMSWALFVAGCPSTLVSQWEVRADSTKDLMVGFHKNLIALRAKGGNYAKARALRQSALALLKSEHYRHPFHWAGFVLIGDPQ